MSGKNQKIFFKDINDFVIGVDEVGRGALSGPVVSCGVLLKKEILNSHLIEEINDSKKLSPKKDKYYQFLSKKIHFILLV